VRAGGGERAGWERGGNCVWVCFLHVGVSRPRMGKLCVGVFLACGCEQAENGETVCGCVSCMWV
jgi:hypothetical protein